MYIIEKNIIEKLNFMNVCSSMKKQVYHILSAGWKFVVFRTFFSAILWFSVLDYTISQFLP